MGITIHYRFMMRNREAVIKMLNGIKEIAEKLGMRIVRDEAVCLIIHPHKDCETLHLDFRKWKDIKKITEWNYVKETMNDYGKVLHDEDFVSSGFTKTQYAGYKTHVLVAELLRKVAGKCTLAYVSDEADYYETRNIGRTTRNFDESSKMISMVASKLKEAFGKENVYCSIDKVEK